MRIEDFEKHGQEMRRIMPLNMTCELRLLDIKALMQCKAANRIAKTHARYRLMSDFRPAN